MHKIRPVKVTTGQRSNLLKLATYLETLPKDYERFDMATFYDKNDWGDAGIAVSDLKQIGCGTVACAAGHGPAAGIKFTNVYAVDGDHDWGQYSRDNFSGEDRNFWEWMFGGDWGGYDNSHWGAAARIRYFLENDGIPELFFQKQFRKHHFVKEYEPYKVLDCPLPTPVTKKELEEV